MTDLMRLSLETSLTSSLKGLAKEADNVMLLIDTSGSMSSPVRREDGTYGKRAIELLREVVADIKAAGSCPMIAFGGPYDAQVRFVDNVPEPDGGTPLHIAIPLAKQYGATRVVVISDGCPDLTEESMLQARAFGGRVDVVFCGSKGDSGEIFLRALAEATGGTCNVGDLTNPKELGRGVIGLLEGDVDPAAPVIMGEGFASVAPEDVVEPEEDEEDEDEDEDDEDDEDDE